jgi:hypothetical protein
MSQQSSTKAPQPQGKRPAQPSTQPAQPLKQSSQPSMKKRPGPSTPSLGWSVKKFWRRNWLWVIGICIILFIGLGSWYGSSRSSSSAALPQATVAATNSTVQATPASQATSAPITPVATGNWRIAQTFTGSDTGDTEQKTKTFTVTDNWQLTWACQGQNGVDDTLYVSIYYADGTLYNAGAQITCIAAKQVVGNVAEANGGTFYLKINANTLWTVTVQEQK